MNWYLKCFKQYADFSGRARRKEYWHFVLFNVIISFVLGFIDGFTGMIISEEYSLGVLSGIYSLAVLIPGIAVGVRRLHDIGKSGWNYFLALIPLVGTLILLIWFLREGERCSNNWGEDPKANEA